MDDVIVWQLMLVITLHVNVRAGVKLYKYYSLTEDVSGSAALVAQHFLFDVSFLHQRHRTAGLFVRVRSCYLMLS